MPLQLTTPRKLALPGIAAVAVAMAAIALPQATAEPANTCTEIEVDFALARAAPVVDLNLNMPQAVALLVAGCVIAVAIIRVALCRRAWGELPPARSESTSGSHMLLVPNWRNYVILLAMTLDGFMMGAPAFVAQVPWLTYLPVKLVARAMSFSGIRMLWLYGVLAAAGIAATLLLACMTAASNYGFTGKRDGNRANDDNSLHNINAPPSPSVNGLVARMSDEEDSREAVSARDPRDGGFWQPRTSLSTSFAAHMYLMSTVFLLPFLILLLQTFTCAFPTIPIIFPDATASACDVKCWDGTHYGLAAAASILLLLLLPIATLGFVTQQRLDADHGTAHVATYVRHQSRRVLSIAQAATTPTAAGAAAGMPTTDGASTRSFSVQSQRNALRFQSSQASVSSRASVGSEGSEGRAWTATSGGSQSQQQLLQQHGLPPMQLVVQPAVTRPTNMLQLQQTARYVFALAASKALLALCVIIMARVYVRGAVVCTAVVNSLLLVDVWRFDPLAVRKLRVLPRLMHLLATITSWLVLLNHVLVPLVPTTAWGTAAPADAEAQASAANSDGLFNSNVVVLGTAGMWFLTLVSVLVVYVRVQRATYGSTVLFASKAEAAAMHIKQQAKPAGWSESFWRRSSPQLNDDSQSTVDSSDNPHSAGPEAAEDGTELWGDMKRQASHSSLRDMTVRAGTSASRTSFTSDRMFGSNTGSVAGSERGSVMRLRQPDLQVIVVQSDSDSDSQDSDRDRDRDRGRSRSRNGGRDSTSLFGQGPPGSVTAVSDGSDEPAPDAEDTLFGRKPSQPQMMMPASAQPALRVSTANDANTSVGLSRRSLSDYLTNSPRRSPTASVVTSKSRNTTASAFARPHNTRVESEPRRKPRRFRHAGNSSSRSSMSSSGGSTRDRFQALEVQTAAAAGDEIRPVQLLSSRSARL